MAANSSIEWTDAPLKVVALRFPQEVQKFNHICFWAASRCIKPFPHVPIAFRAVASDTGRNDVVRLRRAAFADRVEVVPCCCWRAAVNTAAIRRIKTVFLSKHRDRINTALPAMGMLPSFGTIERVVCVACSLIGCMVCSAHSCLNLVNWNPCRTSTTPRHTFSSLLAPFGFRRPTLLTNIAPCGADTRQPIAARVVNTKRRNRVPVFACRTPLQSSGNARGVLLNGQPNAARRNLDNALFAAHY